MSTSLTIKNEILDDYFGSSATKMGTPLEIGLSSTPPNQDGTNVTEPVGGSYYRLSVDNSDSEWSRHATGGYVENINQKSFAVATGNWGTVSHWVIFQNGLVKFFGVITDDNFIEDPKTINVGDQFVFVANGIRIQLT